MLQVLHDRKIGAFASSVLQQPQALGAYAPEAALRHEPLADAFAAQMVALAPLIPPLAAVPAAPAAIQTRPPRPETVGSYLMSAGARESVSQRPSPSGHCSALADQPGAGLKSAQGATAGSASAAVPSAPGASAAHAGGSGSGNSAAAPAASTSGHGAWYGSTLVGGLGSAMRGAVSAVAAVPALPAAFGRSVSLPALPALVTPTLRLPTLPLPLLGRGGAPPPEGTLVQPQNSAPHGIGAVSYQPSGLATSSAGECTDSAGVAAGRAASEPAASTSDRPGSTGYIAHGAAGGNSGASWIGGLRYMMGARPPVAPGAAGLVGGMAPGAGGARLASTAEDDDTFLPLTAEEMDPPPAVLWDAGRTP